MIQNETMRANIARLCQDIVDGPPLAGRLRKAQGLPEHIGNGDRHEVIPGVVFNDRRLGFEA